MNRWKNFFGSEHMSSQIWCSLKLVRWRDEKWDEEMKRWKKNFWVWTYVKPNLVLSQISEMKKWTDGKIFLSEHTSSQIWCYLKLVRWRDEQWDEEMKRWKKNFWVWTYVKPNLVLSEISEMKRWRVRWRNEEMKKKNLGLNICQAKSGVIWN